MDPLKIEDEMVRFSFEDEMDPLKIEDEIDPSRNEDTMDLIMEMSKKRQKLPGINLRNWPKGGIELGRNLNNWPKEKTKKCVLIGLKHPRINNTDVKEKILRLKAKLMELRGFPEDNIALMIDQDEEEEEEEKNLQPTDFQIRRTLFSLLHSARRGDILYIHLIAYGCSDGRIITSDKDHIEDSFLRELIVVACEQGYNLTLVSDCLIEPAACSCEEKRPTLHPAWGGGGDNISLEEGRKKMMEYISMKPKIYLAGFKFLQPTNLSYVDILNTPNEEKKKDDDGSYSRVILLTHFRPVQNAATIHNPLHNVSELFIPPPPNILLKHASYGVLTDAILDVFEETHGQVTNLELAQISMKKLGGGIIPTLRCSHHNHAHTSFLC